MFNYDFDSLDEKMLLWSLGFFIFEIFMRMNIGIVKNGSIILNRY